MALPVIHLYGPPLAPPVDLSRWMLKRLGIPYEFSPAAAGLSALRSWQCSVPIELPLLTVDGVPSGGLRQTYALITGPVAAAYGKPPLKVDPAFAEMLFACLFGPAVRIFYWHMLPCPKLLKPMATISVPMWHRLVIRYAYPFWHALMRRGLKLDAHDPAQAKARIEKSFAAIEERLAGRAFMGGDAPSDEAVLFRSQQSRSPAAGTPGLASPAGRDACRIENSSLCACVVRRPEASQYEPMPSPVRSAD